MTSFDPANVTLRALKILRKGHRKKRNDPVIREKLKTLNSLIENKQRIYYAPKPKEVKKK